MATAPIIEVKHLYKNFGDQTALKNLDFSIQMVRFLVS